jgi:hypothetical protein
MSARGASEAGAGSGLEGIESAFGCTTEQPSASFVRILVATCFALFRSADAAPTEVSRVVFALTNMEMTELHQSALQSRGANLAHSFLDLTFDSSQYGALDESTGDFFPEGQN